MREEFSNLAEQTDTRDQGRKNVILSTATALAFALSSSAQANTWQFENNLEQLKENAEDLSEREQELLEDMKESIEKWTYTEAEAIVEAFEDDRKSLKEFSETLENIYLDPNISEDLQSSAYQVNQLIERYQNVLETKMDKQEQFIDWLQHIFDSTEEVELTTGTTKEDFSHNHPDSYIAGFILGDALSQEAGFEPWELPPDGVNFEANHREGNYYSFNLSTQGNVIEWEVNIDTGVVTIMNAEEITEEDEVEEK